jgi:DNA-binding PadR family transcriptional regulator
MAEPRRVTGPLLDIAEQLVQADVRGEDLYGWQLMKDTKRSGPTVYSVLDRLEALQWITRHWEELPPGENRPRRRLYRLTDSGRTEVHALLAERRPEALRELAGPPRRGWLARSPGEPLPDGI